MQLLKKTGLTKSFFSVMVGMAFLSCGPLLWANQAAQIPKIMGRGLVNVATSPLEIFRTPVVEFGQHRYLWPLTFGFRTLGNFTSRLTSGLYDFGVYPLATPFLDQTPPLTSEMGIADYIWQTEDAY